jgi:hypothetical protein
MGEIKTRCDGKKKSDNTVGKLYLRETELVM